MDIEEIENLIKEIKISLKEVEKADESLQLELELQFLTFLQKSYLQSYEHSLEENPSGDHRFLNGALEVAKTRHKLLGVDGSREDKSAPIRIILEERRIESKHGRGSESEDSQS